MESTSCVLDPYVQSTILKLQNTIESNLMDVMQWNEVGQHLNHIILKYCDLFGMNWPMERLDDCTISISRTPD